MSAHAPRTRECLSAIVACAGANFQTGEGLKPVATNAKAAGVGVAEAAQLAVFGYLGDVSLRFVFTAPDCMESPVRMEDMQRLDLTPQRALALASMNLKRTQGAPQVGLFTQGVYTLRGANPDANATYLLDRAFWRGQFERSAQGVLVAVPKRGSLFFAYAADSVATQALRDVAARLYHAADEQGLSGYVYRFDAQGWHVHERLPSPRVEQHATSAPRLREAASRDGPGNAKLLAARAAHRREEDLDERLAAAAKGQRMVIHCILLNMLLGALERSNTLPAIVRLALSIGVAVYALVGLVRMCSGLDKSQVQKIVFMVLAFMPLVNLVALVYLSHQTSKLLRQSGWSVGLLGARP